MDMMAWNATIIGPYGVFIINKFNIIKLDKL